VLAREQVGAQAAERGEAARADHRAVAAARRADQRGDAAGRRDRRALPQPPRVEPLAHFGVGVQVEDEREREREERVAGDDVAAAAAEDAGEDEVAAEPADLDHHPEERAPQVVQHQPRQPPVPERECDARARREQRHALEQRDVLDVTLKSFSLIGALMKDAELSVSPV
jgi:hypothetical protein